MRLVVGSDSARSQNVGRIQVVRKRNNLFGQHVPAEDALLVAELIVDPDGNLMVIFVKDVASHESSAGIERFRKPSGDLDRSRAQERWINRVVDEGRSQGDLAAVLAGWGSKCRKVASQHLRCGNKCRSFHRILPDGCSLVTRKEKDLVFLDRAADGATELVALQTVVPQRKKIAGVELLVAHELEQIAMNRVGAGFRHSVD